ncbi:TonB-dependent siderophore receptor [Phenylobacterium sp.]|uniref:TonB-dependent siderophore receptor n=1 Tax=Phenylobacterium sp. TaxID=1871053 RepID=UPI00289E5D5F|nr:TonB-dependent siderophore receptor [Phenylobacterium sp.]
MTRLLTSALLAATALSGLCAATARAEVMEAAAGAGDASEVEGVLVQGNRLTTAAVGLDLSLRETPQSVTVVPREQIQDFALDTVNDLLAHVPGINVEKIETDRTYYNSRGFDITNFQVDGIGLPLIWGIQFGDLDTALFERVEAVRGASSMMTGSGNPSATINYVRKRPTKTFRADASIQYGSWEDIRLEADVSGPLNADGTVAGRLVYANQDRDSYLDYYGVNRNVYYGVLSWDLTPNLTVTGGYSYQDNRARGVLWGALPLVYSDGTFVDYPVSASTSADWTYWHTQDQTAFGEVKYAFANGWAIRGVLTHQEFEEHAKLLYAFGAPEPDTGLGVFGMTGVYPSTYKRTMLDVYASGPFSAFGREHELVVGGHVSRSHGLEYENFAEDYPAYPAVGLWGREQVAQPAYPGEYLAADQTDRMQRVYAAAHLNLTDRLKGIVGFNALKVKSKGFSYGVDTPRDEDAISPYVGVVFDLTPDVSLYASYTDIFNPQSEVDVNHQTLEAAQGKSYEAGIKSQWFGGKLYATASIFKSEQMGLAEFAGTFDDGKSYYSGVDTYAKGYELEVAGRVTDQWTLAGGWTDLSIEGQDDQDVRTYLPRKTLKLSTTYTVPELRNLKLGAALRWQDDIHIEDIVTIAQDAYAILDLMASIDITDQVRATVNVKNATDEKYLSSLMWNQSYYAAPRSVSVRLNYSF